MADHKIHNPRVVGKLKLPSEVASKVLQINASGELESSTITTVELGYLSGVTSGIQAQLNAKALASDLSTHVNNTSNPHSVTAAQVGLGNVDNTSDATKNSAVATLTNKTIDAASNTISNIANSNIATNAAIALTKLATVTASKALASDVNGNIVASSVTDTELGYVSGVTSSIQTQLGNKISSSEKGANNGVATLDAGGKVPVSQLPNSVMTYEGTFDASSVPASPLLNGDGAANAGMVYLASVAGSYDFGAGAITFAVGDWAVYNGTIWEKSVNSNSVVSVNGQTGVVTLTKSDVGLGNVDNTSDATKNSATATLTNKTISASSNTISDLTVTNLATGVLDSDLSSVSANHDTIPSAKATKAYVDSLVGASGVSGDIALTSFAASDNVAVAANITGLAFAAGVTRSFRAQVSVYIDATAPVAENFEIMGVQTAAGFVMSINSVGDDSGIALSITSAGQVQYTSTAHAGWVSSTIKFRAETTTI